MSIKVVVVDMNRSITSEVCQIISKVSLQEVSLYLEQASQTAFMLACLATHTEVSDKATFYPATFYPPTFHPATFYSATFYQTKFHAATFQPAGELDKLLT